MKHYWRPLLGTVILVGFLAFVQHYLGWRRLLAPWLTLSANKILLAMALTLLSYWFRAMRFYDYFFPDMGGRFSLCIKMMLLHNLFNNLLPMRSGELSFPVLMNRYFKVPSLRSIPALLWLRLLDLHVLGLIGIAALLISKLPLFFTLVALVGWLALPIVSLFLGRHLRQFPIISRWYARLAPLLRGLPTYRAAHWRAWGWTLVNWLVKLGTFAWMLTLFVHVTLPAAWMGALAGDLTSVLPIHGVAGAGTYEAGVVTALLPYGVVADQALVAAINLHLFLLGTTLAGGAAAVLIRTPRDG